MKKFIIFLKVYWVKLLLITLAVLAVGGTIYYIFTSSSNYMSLEPYTRRQLSGQMAAMMPMFLIVQVLAILVMLGVQMYMMSGGSLGSFSKKKLNEAKMDVKWSDVIGMEDAKKEAWEIVKLLKDRSSVKTIGGNIVKGTMFLGPPGCGKTYLAKAMATECGLPMITAVGSEFVAMFMGQGAARIKALFKQARKMAAIEGGCIIFIDEIDAFAQPRQMERGMGAQTSHNATINQFLTELDGVRHKENNIVVFAATNADEDDLDPALMRSGRFDRKIHIEKPNAKERMALLNFYLRRVNADSGIDIEYFSEKAQWFSPSDINNMVREAGIIALRENRRQLGTKDLEAGLSRVMVSVEQMGEDKILSNKINVPWDSVIGMESVKKEAWEIVELLRDHSKLKAVGGRIVKGVMMFGPPGCGKTYLAKAMATEAGFPFIAKAGSEFVGTFIGVGSAKMKSMFEEARKVAKAEGGCLIFIDEIDAFARHRTEDRGFGGATDHNATVNQFLTELDGMRQAENNIVVLAATNAREDELDSAIMRAGRFDRKIYVTAPNLKEREELFQFYLSRVQHEKNIDPAFLARRALYFTPSDIESMVREAGLFALRDKAELIENKHLTQAYERVTFGMKSNITLTEEEKVWTAYHEAGHAVVAYILHPSNDVIKATIIPHKGSLGFVSQRPVEELHSSNKAQLLANITVAVAAYVAEEIKFGSTSSGVGGGRGSDFDTAMRHAHGMVWSLGMGKSGLIGDFSALSGHGNNYISEKTIETLNSDVQDILQTCMKKAREILVEHNEVFEYFSQELLKKEELDYDEIVAIFDKFGIQPAAKKPKAL